MSIPLPPSPKPSQSITSLFIKLLLIVTILLLFPKGVVAGKKKKRLDRRVSNMKRTCANDMNHCGKLIPEENMACVSMCMSPTCHETHYQENPLEDGEIDPRRWNNFESCVRNELKQQGRTAANVKNR